MASPIPMRTRKTDWWVVPRVLCLVLSAVATVAILLKVISLLR